MHRKSSVNIWATFLNISVYGNVHISIIGAFMFYKLHASLDNAVQYSVIFSAMIFIYYSLSQIISVRNFEDINGSNELTWVNKNLTEIIFASGFVSTIFLYLVHRYIGILAFFSEVYLVLALGILYFFVKKYLGLKNLMIGLTWILALSMFQSQEQGVNWYYGLYISGISFIYDKVKDIRGKWLIDTALLLPLAFI